MAEKGYGGQFVGGANGCEMVDVDQKADAKELDASGSSGSGGVEQGGVGRGLVVVEEAFRGDVRDVEWAIAHVEFGVGCLGLGGDVVAGDDGGKAIGEFSKVEVGAVAVQNLQSVGEGAGFGAGVGIDGGAGADVDVLLAVLAAETDGLEEAVGGRVGEDGCHFCCCFVV